MITLFFFFSSSDDFVKYILSHWIHTEILNRVKDELYMLLSRHNIKVVIFSMEEMKNLTSFRFDFSYKCLTLFKMKFLLINKRMLINLSVVYLSIKFSCIYTVLLHWNIKIYKRIYSIFYIYFQQILQYVLKHSNHKGLIHKIS